MQVWLVMFVVGRPLCDILIEIFLKLKHNFRYGNSVLHELICIHFCQIMPRLLIVVSGTIGYPNMINSQENHLFTITVSS